LLAGAMKRIVFVFVVLADGGGDRDAFSSSNTPF